MYKTIKEFNTGEIVVEKSRFIAAVSPVSSESMANAFIEKRRKLNFAAKHHVFAYCLATGQEKAKKPNHKATGMLKAYRQGVGEASEGALWLYR